MTIRRWGAAVAAAAIVAALAGPALASNDPYFDRQWNLAQIGAPAAWDRSTGSGVLIGVVDTGVDAQHPDLAGKVEAMADCVGGTCRPGTARDGEGHGTAVSGIAAAHANNGKGIAGVAPDARLVVAKALGDSGYGDIEDINQGIRWVVDHGARIVNLSLGDDDLVLAARLGTPLRPAIEYAWSRGAIPVLAAGNYESLGERGSANYGTLNAVVVGAVGKDGKVPRYSTDLGDAKWGLVAPGGTGDGPDFDVASPLPANKYAWVAGTSMAAPHVSGVLALLLAQGLGPSAAVDRLLATLDRSSPCGTGCQGRLRADAAVAPSPPAPVGTVRGLAGAGRASDAPTDLKAALAGVALLLALAAAVGTVWTWLQRTRSGSDPPVTPVAR